MANDFWGNLTFQHGLKKSIDPFNLLGGSDQSPWQPTFDSNQQPVSSNISQYFQNLNPNSFSYNGQLTAPIGQGEQDIVNQNSRLNAIAGNTFGQIGQYDPQQVEQNFNNQIAKPTISNWMQDELPYLRESLNGFSSEQGNIANRGFQTLNNNLLQQRMNYNNQAQQNALSALSGGNAYQQGASQIQSIPRVIQQAGLSNAYTNFINSNSSYQKSVDQMLGYLGIQSQAYIAQPNPMQQLAGLASAGANIYGAMNGNPASIASLGSQLGGNGSSSGNGISGDSTNYGMKTSPYYPGNYNINNPSNLPLDKAGY